MSKSTKRPPARETGHLIINRKVGQAILIGRGIRVTLLEVIGDDTVRVMVEAPKHVAVSRDDVTMERHMEFQIIREKLNSASSGG